MNSLFFFLKGYTYSKQAYMDMETFLEGYIRNCQSAPLWGGVGWVAKWISVQEGHICILYILHFIPFFTLTFYTLLYSLSLVKYPLISSAWYHLIQ